jgi:hypothetical protein
MNMPFIEVLSAIETPPFLKIRISLFEKKERKSKKTTCRIVFCLDIGRSSYTMHEYPARDTPVSRRGASESNREK